MGFPEGFYLSEVRNGYYVPAMMKRNWAAQLEVLEDFKRVCEKNDLRFFIDSGTLLGAVRHKGFIPWDDDVDTVMFREDYDRLYNEAYKDFSPEIHAINCENYDGYDEMHGRILNSISVPIDENMMEKYHGFGMPAGLDVFPYDYVPDTPEGIDDFFLKIAPIEVLILQLESVWDDRKELNRAFKEAEDVIGYKLPKSNDYKKQLRLLQDKYLKIVRNMAGKTHHATAINFWARHKHYGVEDISCFAEQEWIPFENMMLPAPIGKETVLREWFGPNYMKEYRGGGHLYPYFFKMMKEEIYANPYINEHIYSIPRNEWAERKQVKGPNFKNCLNNKITVIVRLRQMLFDSLNQGNTDNALIILEKMQSQAVELGTIIEDRYLHCSDEDKEKKQALLIVKNLEEYCEALFEISNGNADGIEHLINSENEVSNRISVFDPKRRLVIFMPDRVANWCSMEPAYKAAATSPDIEVRVIPIPFYYKGRDGKPLSEMSYEGNQLPDYVEVTDYQNFAFDNPCSDAIVIQSAYDNFDDGYTVHPFFYSDKLQTYTEKLVYIPWFKIDEIGEKELGMEIADFFANIPGVVRADKVILESENMKKVYLHSLNKILDEGNLKKMEGRIATCGADNWMDEVFGDK